MKNINSALRLFEAGEHFFTDNFAMTIAFHAYVMASKTYRHKDTKL